MRMLAQVLALLTPVAREALKGEFSAAQRKAAQEARAETFKRCKEIAAQCASEGRPDLAAEYIDFEAQVVARVHKSRA